MNIPKTLIRSNTGKFSSNLEEAIWESTLDGCSEAECGNTETFGHHVLIIFSAEERAALAALRDEDGDPVFGPRPRYAIVTTECSGLVSVGYYTNKAFALSCWARLEQEAVEAAGPQDDDIVTEDHATFREVGSVGGRPPYLTVPQGAPFKAALRRKMRKEGYWPNVWFVNDHGNAHLLNLKGK